MASQWGITVVDYDGQKGSFAINTVPLDAANFAAQSALLDTLRGDVVPLIDGDIQGQRINIAVDYLPSNVKAADPNAQRGNKWVVSCYDNMQFITGVIPNPTYLQPFSYDIPTADLELRVGGSDVIWEVGGAANVPVADDFVTSFEAVAKSPNGGGLQVVKIKSNTRAGG